MSFYTRVQLMFQKQLGNLNFCFSQKVWRYEQWDRKIRSRTKFFYLAKTFKCVNKCDCICACAHKHTYTLYVPEKYFY